MVREQLQWWISVALFVLLTSVQPSASLNYGETVNCTDIVPVETRDEVNRYGECVLYTGGNPCDTFYAVGEDRVFIPHGRALNDIKNIDNFAQQAEIVYDTLRESCRDAARRLLCYYYYPPCGNSTHFILPNSICEERCSYVTETLCLKEWAEVLGYLQLPAITAIVTQTNVPFINCTNPGAPLDPLPHCCSDAGIQMSQESATTFSQPVNSGPNSTVIIPASVIAVVVVLLALILTIIVSLICVKRTATAKVVLQVAGDNIDLSDPSNVKNKLPEISISTDYGTPASSPRYIGVRNPIPPGVETGDQTLGPTFAGIQSCRARVSSMYIRQMDNEKLLIPGRHINLLDCIGKGEFGVVYRGHLTGWDERTTPELVAVKTLKSLDLSSMKEIEGIMEESLKMKSFSHPNVLNLIGVCIDAGEAPYLVMPYMANGSLLTYLRKERPNLTIAEEAGEDVIITAKKKLLSMCRQIAKGMEYLASKKFVHRDLAARNCMIDSGFVIKVADFGLSEDIYARNYFRQVKLKDSSDVKLPIRWMAIESLMDGIFTEKTDVWSYGVTCWEVFSLGRTPYPAVDPFTLIKYLEGGGRLDKPSNAACSDDVYDVMMRCWNSVPDERPSFGDLVISLNILLEGVAGYLDFSALSRTDSDAGKGEGYDHLPKKDCDDGRYDHLMEEDPSSCSY